VGFRSGVLFLASNDAAGSGLLASSGGDRIQSYLGQTQPFDLATQTIVHLADPELDRFHPVLNLYPLYYEPADPLLHAHQVWQEPLVNDDKYAEAGVLVAIHGNGRGTLWSIAEVGGYSVLGVGGAGLGDLDDDGYMDVCSNAVNGGLICVRGLDGVALWVAETDANYPQPAFADMDGDGLVEVIHGRQIFDNRGNLLATGTLGTAQGSSVPVDWDGDGDLEVVVGNGVFELGRVLYVARSRARGVGGAGAVSNLHRVV
jgi:hypothetical protein